MLLGGNSSGVHVEETFTEIELGTDKAVRGGRDSSLYHGALTRVRVG